MTTEAVRGRGWGATVRADGLVQFRLWAPAQQGVSVAFPGGALQAMQRDPDGWFELCTSCPPGTQYQYRLYDGTLVPDPASRAQAKDVHDPSVVVDPGSYCWRNWDWRGRPWEEVVLYELHAGTMGGFDGVTRELARLKQLGITGIELMPVNDFAGRHNWGYDGVLPFAPDNAYGTPNSLKSLVDTAHDHGLMIFLDVVYNHFGPDGNYLPLYAPQFFRTDRPTPWGPAIDFERPEVRSFFTENVLMWLNEYRFDGLRFDAVHAIEDQSWVDEMAAAVRSSVVPGRHVHLVLEHHNDASHLARDVDAQWNDDGHNVLHVLLTGENRGYYADYADKPAGKLARCLAEGWVYQGEHSAYLDGPRGQPSTDLPPTAHVLFLQNHDQIGNRAFGERLTTLVTPEALEAAIALVMLCPQIPLIFMGEETASRTPFLFFTDHAPELGEAVREGRRREFAHFPEFADASRREQIPDPNSLQTFLDSIPRPDPQLGPQRSKLYRDLLTLRQQHIVPRLPKARSAGAQVLGPKAVAGRWHMGDGTVLTLASNLAGEPVEFGAVAGQILYASRDIADHSLSGYCTLAVLDSPQ
jgi:maltooligosyltrehalose trehalohydrolase